MSSLNLRRGVIAFVVFVVLSGLTASVGVSPWPYATPIVAGVSVLVGFVVDASLDGAENREQTE